MTQDPKNNRPEDDMAQPIEFPRAPNEPDRQDPSVKSGGGGYPTPNADASIDRQGAARGSSSRTGGKTLDDNTGAARPDQGVGGKREPVANPDKSMPECEPCGE